MPTPRDGDLPEPPLGYLSSVRTVFDLACALLDDWEARRPEDPAWREGHGRRWDAWMDVYESVYVIAEAWESELLDGSALTAVTDAVQAGIKLVGYDALHAAAFAIDEAAHALFASHWAPAGDVVELVEGQLFYVPEPPPRDILAPGVGQSTRPSSASEPRLGELPHIRRHAPGDVAVRIDTRAARELEALARDRRPLAAAHPNEHPAEFNMPQVGHAVFPVTVVDAERQRERFTALTDAACEADARIIVFPELTGSPELTELVAAEINTRPGPRLVIAGSHHELRSDDGVNVAAGVLAYSGVRLHHEKLTPFFGEGKTKEGIRRATHLTLYDAGPYRFAIAICKDLLSENTRELYARYGANVILVPAMSQKTEDFATAAGELVSSRQAVTLVANAILALQSATPVEPSSVLGQPVRGARVIQSTHPGPAPGLTIYKVGEPGPIQVMSM